MDFRLDRRIEGPQGFDWKGPLSRSIPISRRLIVNLVAVTSILGCSPSFAPAPGEGVEPSRDSPLVAPRPPVSARTAAEFDTTTPEQRQAATEPVAAAETSLGTTVASLGDPTEGGLWLSTPLVDAPRAGRVVVEATGASARVDLLPGDGGSRLSLAAMRLLKVPLTDLPRVTVYVR